MLVVPIITMVVTVLIAWFAAQQSQSELRYKVETLEKNENTTATERKANADAINQLVITMTKISEAQARMASDLKDLQDEQRRRLMNGK